MGVCMHIDGVECDNCRGQRYWQQFMPTTFPVPALQPGQQFHFYYPPHVLDQILVELKGIREELAALRRERGPA